MTDDIAHLRDQIDFCRRWCVPDHPMNRARGHLGNLCGVRVAGDLCRIEHMAELMGMALERARQERRNPPIDTLTPNIKSSLTRAERMAAVD